MTEKNSSSISILHSSSDRRLVMLKSALAHCPDAALTSSFSLFTVRMVIFSIYYRLVWRWELRHHHDSVWNSLWNTNYLHAVCNLEYIGLRKWCVRWAWGKHPRSVRISPWRKQCLNIDNSTWPLEIWVIEDYWWKDFFFCQLSFLFHRYARMLFEWLLLLPLCYCCFKRG